MGPLATGRVPRRRGSNPLRDHSLQGEISDVWRTAWPDSLVAVIVTCTPAPGATGSTPSAWPLASVVTSSVSRYVSASPLPDGSQLLEA